MMVMMIGREGERVYKKRGSIDGERGRGWREGGRKGEREGDHACASLCPQASQKMEKDGMQPTVLLSG